MILKSVCLFVRVTWCFHFGVRFCEGSGINVKLRCITINMRFPQREFTLYC